MSNLIRITTLLSLVSLAITWTCFPLVLCDQLDDSVASDPQVTGVDADANSLPELVRPRQYFKLHVVPSPISKKAAMTNKLRKSTEGEQTSIKMLSNGSGKVLNQQSISNKALKKLLSQALLAKSTAGNSSSPITFGGNSSKGPSFKFLSIQHSPSSNSSSSDKVSSTTTNPTPNSLAVSVSKQLASSLLNSAVDLVGDLSSGSPSISSLASQIASVASLASSKTSNDNASVELKRLKQPTTPADPVTVVALKTIATSSDRKYQSKSKTRPSRIYNLPVKFVANGQPNGITFQSIKHHLTTIKKIHEAATAMSTKNKPIGSSTIGKIKQSKLRGMNSKIIYLPLKYLSNAQPFRISSTKASHKSSRRRI